MCVWRRETANEVKGGIIKCRTSFACVVVAFSRGNLHAATEIIISKTTLPTRWPHASLERSLQANDCHQRPEQWQHKFFTPESEQNDTGQFGRGPKERLDRGLTGSKSLARLSSEFGQGTLG